MKKIYKSTIVLIIIMFISKVVAFLRDIVLTYYYGASYISDAFLVAASIPTVLFSGVMTALYTCYIPFYKELKEKRPKEVNGFNSNLISVIFIVSTVLMLTYWIFDDFVLKLFAVGFDEKTFVLTQELANIMASVMVFMGVVYILQGFLQANDSFYLVGAMTIPSNIVIALAIAISGPETLHYMAWGMVISYVLYIPYFGIPAYKKGFHIKPYINLKDENLKKILIMIMPIFMGQIVFELNSMIDKSVASLLPHGSVTALDYSYKVISMIHASIAAPIAIIVYPKFTDYMVRKKTQELKLLLNQVLRTICMIVIPIVGGAIVYSEQIIELLYYHGTFSKQAVTVTAESMIGYVFCAIPISLRVICEKVFYARKESKVPMVNSMVGVLINIILDFALVHKFAHMGLALATTISAIVTLVLFLCSLSRRIGDFGFKSILITMIKASVATLLMVGILTMVQKSMSMASHLMQILVGVIIGIVIYAITILILKEKMLINFLNNRR